MMGLNNILIYPRGKISMHFNIKEKPIYVLGTGLSHDGSACLLKDGKICVAIEKERITRIKRDGKNDTDAIEYCLRTEGISLEDLSVVVQNANFGFFEYGNDYYYGDRLFNNKLNIPVITISHHLAHAYNAIGTMPYHSAAILVMDGCGSLMDECIDMKDAIIPENISDNIKHLYAEKDSFYIYSNNKLINIFKDFSPLGHFLKDYPMHPPTTKDSIGGIYKAVSNYVFGDMSDVGKLMGLAPYGRPGIYKEKIFEYKEGRIFVNYDWMKKFRSPARSKEMFKRNFQYFADIAYWAQKEVEEAIIYVINSRSSLANIESLAYTGGTALNAVANARILKETPFKNLYLTPAAGDNGLAIGCAYYGWLEILKKPRIIHDGNTFFGKIYNKADIKKDIDAFLIATTDSNQKEVYQELFSRLAQCIKVEATQEDRPSKIQFVLSDADGFSLLKNKDGTQIIYNPIDKPDCRISTDVITLVRSLTDKEYYTNAIYNKKLVEFAKENILSIFDPLKIKQQISKIIKKYKVKKINYYCPSNIFLETAKLLANGKVVAWFQDGCEFGPRALGHRSILADPRLGSMKDFINSNIKFREDFRPFAPSILQEHVSEYFYFEGESPYMILVAQAREICRNTCPGVVHADNSSRIQTVTLDKNIKYYHLIQEFKNLTGIPMLLNTSFNKKGMPIVETPMEALGFFYECALDNLVIDKYLFYK